VASSPKPTKTCVVCGRTIEWRKKWERDWDQVRYCSAGDGRPDRDHPGRSRGRPVDGQGPDPAPSGRLMGRVG
jgi:hypothetical protein